MRLQSFALGVQKSQEMFFHEDFTAIQMRGSCPGAYSTNYERCEFHERFDMMVV